MSMNEPKSKENKRQRGRPTMLGEKMIQTAVWLPREQIEWLKSQGNLSEQVRALIEREMQNAELQNAQFEKRQAEEAATLAHREMEAAYADRNVCQGQLDDARFERASIEERLEHALSLCESVSLWNADEITDSELSNGLTKWLLFLGELKECAGCGEIMDNAASGAVFSDGHKSYLCGECTRDGDHS